jgi:hypothetical protein
MMRPCGKQDAILQHVASWGDRDPHAAIKQIMLSAVNGFALTMGAASNWNIRFQAFKLDDRATDFGRAAG